MAAGAGGAWRTCGKKGHKVFAPTLTGVGERSHLLSKDINLDTHIADIVNLFKWEDLKDVCLWRIPTAAGRALAPSSRSDRVSSIVWLDAFKPENGQRGLDFISEFSRKALLRSDGEGRARPAGAARRRLPVNEKDRAWVDSKTTRSRTAWPLQPIKLTGAREKVAKKTYIRAAIYPQPAFDKAFAECKADKTWRTFETTTAGHDVMVDAPEWLVDVLLQVS